MNTYDERDEYQRYLDNEGYTIVEYEAWHSESHNNFIGIALATSPHGEYIVWENYGTTTEGEFTSGFYSGEEAYEYFLNIVEQSALADLG